MNVFQFVNFFFSFKVVLKKTALLDLFECSQFFIITTAHNFLNTFFSN